MFWYTQHPSFPLTEAVRRTPSTSACTDAEIKEEMLHYLKGASDRDGGRHARRQVAAAAAAAAANADDVDVHQEYL